MLINLFYGLGTMLLCLFLQAFLLVVAMRYYATRESKIHDAPSFFSGVFAIGGVMLLLVIGNLAQVAVWALLFYWLDEFQLFNDAFYHSAVNFATLGYGDIVMSDTHKLLGPLEAINGVLMIGVSTAALLAAFQDKLKKLSRRRKAN